MKRIYKMIGLLIITTLIIVGCSSKDEKPEQPKEDDIIDLEIDEKQDEEENIVHSTTGPRSKILIDMMNAKEYTMKIRQTIIKDDIETVGLATHVVADNQLYSHTDLGGGVIEFIEKDDKTYLVMHESKSVVVMNTKDEDEETSGSLIYDDLVYLDSGNEMFLDNKRDYEEYEVELGVVKYYFDGKKLDGMKMLFDLEKLLEEDDDDFDRELLESSEATMIIELLSFDKEADMTVFELPEDYSILGD